MGYTYADTGVNVDVEDKASKMMFEAAKKSFENRIGDIGEIIVPYVDLSGVRVINIGGLPKDSFMCIDFDGVGTKAEVAQMVGKHDTLAYDLFAMVCDDAIARGGEPILIGSVFDVDSLGNDPSRLKIVEQICDGYVNAAKAGNVSIINGEVAQLGSAVGGVGKLKYNWSAALVWVATKQGLFTGTEINIGDAIVVLKEEGFRSNGLTLVRKIFKEEYGEDWVKEKFEGKSLGEQVLTPSIIYTKPFVEMHGGFNSKPNVEIHGAFHITGGGIPLKLGRVLKQIGYGANLYNLFDPPKVMEHCQKLGNVEDHEAYCTWNMGQGFGIITPEPKKVIEIAKKHGVEAQIGGKITENPRITITSKGVFKSGEELVYDKYD